MSETMFLSIGEVLAQLLEEFPDVTISKIRFLETQGLIEPERTPSGYRKFTDTEVERLRFILREQRTNYLPLRVIKNRLEDESADISRDFMISPEDITTSTHPAAQGAMRKTQSTSVAPSATGTVAVEQDPIVPQSVMREQRVAALTHMDNTESIPRDQLLNQSHIDPSFLKELESAALVTGHEVGDTTFFNAHSIAIAEVAGRFFEMGIDIRHLRSWKTSADREVSLFEQRILPLLRQRNPAAREEALNMLVELIDLGAQLRMSLIMRDVARLTEPK
jgi:DNA-binding transcriptional MerR regulator